MSLCTVYLCIKFILRYNINTIGLEIKQKKKKMFKKIMSLMCCLVPFGAVAEPLVYPNNATFDGLDATTNVYHFTGGSGFVVGTGGMTVTHGLSVGAQIPAASPDGWVYVGPDTNSSYTILSSGNIEVLGALTVANGRTLGIHANATDNAQISEAYFGAIENLGTLTIDDGIVGLYAQHVTSNGDLTLGAEYITVQDLAATGTGNTTITATDTLEAEKLQNDSTGKFVVNAGSLDMRGPQPEALAGSIDDETVGNIQNNAGDMEINVNNGSIVYIDGNLENSGDSLTFNAVNSSINVGGTVKNDSANGTLVINAGSLQLNGGDDNNASFVNGGNVNINVSGETYFANGVDLSTMGTDNTFSLTTGRIYWGNTTEDQVFAMMSNDAKQFDLNVTRGELDVLDIQNGANNKNAIMNIKAGDIWAQDVYASGGTLNMVAEVNNDAVAGSIQPYNDSNSVYGEIAIKSLTTAQDATAHLTASSYLYVDENVSNSGNTTLNAETIMLGQMLQEDNASEPTVSGGNLVNDGGNLRVVAYTDEYGSVGVMGNVNNNSGSTLIEGRNIAILGNVINKNGSTTIKGSDLGEGPITMGGLDVQGGTTNIDALIGQFAIAEDDRYLTGSGDLTVTGGVLNIGGNTNTVNVAGSVEIAGNITATSATTGAAGDVNVATKGVQGFVLASDNTINVDGDITATDASNVRKMGFSAAGMTVGGDVVASGQGNIAFIYKIPDVGAPTTYDMYIPELEDVTLDVTGDVVAQNGGTVEIYNTGANVASLVEQDGLINLYGEFVVADQGGINIKNGIWYDSSLNPTRGLSIIGTDGMTLQSTGANQDIDVAGGITVMAATRDGLTLKSANNINVSGLIDAGGELNLVANKLVDIKNDTTVGGSLYASGTMITAQDITNTGLTTLLGQGNVNAVSVENVTNSGAFTANANNVSANSITSTAGLVSVDAKQFDVSYGLTVSGGGANIDAERTIVGGDISVAGDLNQGTAKNGTLNLTADESSVQAVSMNIGGNFVADENTVSYNITDLFNVVGNVSVADGAGVMVNAKSFATQNLENSGSLAIFAQESADFADVVNNGTLYIGSGNGFITMNSLAMNDGMIQLSGAGLDLATPFTTDGTLYQNYAGTLASRDVNVASSDYVINTSNMNVGAIDQKSGAMVVNSSDIDVSGNIDAVDLAFVASPYANWMDVSVGGDVSGGVDFIGLEQMSIGGNYTFDENSRLNVAILKYADGTTMNSSAKNYWATVSLAEDDTLGDITNAADAEPMISVNGKFISGKVYDSGLNLGNKEVQLADSQIGINIFDAVDQGTAIWLLNAKDGIEEFDALAKVRNLEVMFCNADGSKCFNYLDAIDANNKSGEELPAYISVRDADANGENDSLYVVFDPRFGGPVLIENMRIQPIVGREPDHTDGEYMAAGALDDLLDGQLVNQGFFNSTPIEVIPLLFEGTDMSKLANELYNRMEHYVANAEGAPLARFSRLVQPREIEQIAGAVMLNEHTAFRDFEDRMMDEFIWNRNRSLKKAWVDVDYGMFRQNVTDNKRVGGNRFSVAGGFDWQESETLILGLTGRVSHMSSDNSDSMDLSYGAITEQGNVSVSVTDTNIGLGGYLAKTLTNSVRAYGNAFLDIHMLDTDRNMNFMDTIDGDGMALALTSEWGLMHDWLNQYIVGNLYARVGYNFGFSVDETAGSGDYMNMESDGYLMLTPGYTLTAQKRIYPTAWFQIRPYASIGVEYDVLGAPGQVQYKFGPAHSFTDYALDIDPLWANIGGGFELISATGIQIGVDYRYQYNDAIQLHNIKVSGSYRF